MKDEDIKSLPISQQRICDLIGMTPTLALMFIWGGERSWIPEPKNLSENHPLVVCLGMDDAMKLCEEFGGGLIYIPTGASFIKFQRNRMIRERVAAGERKQDVAKELRLSNRTVLRVCAEK